MALGRRASVGDRFRLSTRASPRRRSGNRESFEPADRGSWIAVTKEQPEVRGRRECRLVAVGVGVALGVATSGRAWRCGARGSAGHSGSRGDARPEGRREVVDRTVEDANSRRPLDLTALDVLIELPDRLPELLSLRWGLLESRREEQGLQLVGELQGGPGCDASIRHPGLERCDERAGRRRDGGTDGVLIVVVVVEVDVVLVELEVVVVLFGLPASFGEFDPVNAPPSVRPTTVPITLTPIRTPPRSPRFPVHRLSGVAGAGATRVGSRSVSVGSRRAVSPAALPARTVVVSAEGCLTCTVGPRVPKRADSESDAVRSLAAMRSAGSLDVMARRRLSQAALRSSGIGGSRCRRAAVISAGVPSKARCPLKHSMSTSPRA